MFFFVSFYLSYIVSYLSIAHALRILRNNLSFVLVLSKLISPFTKRRFLCYAWICDQGKSTSIASCFSKIFFIENFSYRRKKYRKPQKIDRFSEVHVGVVRKIANVWPTRGWHLNGPTLHLHNRGRDLVPSRVNMYSFLWVWLWAVI